MKIVFVGDLGVDDYLLQNIKKPGGIAFNAATHAVSHNGSVSLVSAIGNDKNGEKIKKLLTTMPVDSSHVHSEEGETAEQKIQLEKSGERKFVGYKAGVLKDWKLKKNDLDFIASHDAIFVPLTDGMEHIFENIINLKTTAKKAVDFSQDYEFADFDKKDNIVVRYAKFFDIIFIGGRKDHYAFVGELAKEYPEKVFVLTLGKKGSLAFFQNKQYKQKNMQEKQRVDTTGCGDAFQSVFLATYLKTKNIVTSLHEATKEATLVIEQLGSTQYEI